MEILKMVWYYVSRVVALFFITVKHGINPFAKVSSQKEKYVRLNQREKNWIKKENVSFYNYLYDANEPREYPNKKEKVK